jgi:hypothetical protein
MANRNKTKNFHFTWPQEEFHMLRRLVDLLQSTTIGKVSISIAVRQAVRDKIAALEAANNN